MNIEEAANLLKVQSYQDGRQPSDGQVAVWADSLADLDHDEALAAMRSLWRDSTDYLTPALVRQRVKVLRSRAEVDGRRARMLDRHSAIEACDLCDDHGYRLPAARIVCTHAAPSAVGWAQRVRAAIGSTSPEPPERSESPSPVRETGETVSAPQRAPRATHAATEVTA